MTVTTIYANNDGDVKRSSVDESWSTITGGNGTGVNNGAYPDYPMIYFGPNCSTTTNQFQNIYRALISFNTSALPDGDTIISATLSPYSEGDDNYTQLSGTQPTAVVTGGNPASATTFEAGDYQDRLSVLLSDTADTFEAWVAGEGYRDFPLNSHGRAYISKTGYTTFYLLTNWDQSGTFGGTWGSNQEVYFCFSSAVQTGTTRDSKLVITHENPPHPGVGLGSGNCMIF